MARREPRLEPGPWAVLCRSEWSRLAFATAAHRLTLDDRLEPAQIRRLLEWRAGELLEWWGPRGAGMGDWSLVPRTEWDAARLRDWYASGGELP